MKKDILSKLLQIQARLNAPKNQYNEFGKYKFRNCEDIIEAVKPILKELNVILTLSDQVEYIGNRYYIKAFATLSDCDTDQSYSVSALAREEETKKGMDAAQITGSSSSYARKYALNGLFAIDDAKDPDTNENRKETQAAKNNNICNPSAEMISKEQIEAINAEIRRTGVSLLNVLGRYHLDSLSKMTQEQFEKCMHVFGKMQSEKDC